nr:adenylyl-sulfate kinase [uncultured Sphingosinicella sp.]
MPDQGGAPKSLLRFVTCGSVDDGKSTLLGRLLFETGKIPEDQLATLRASSRDGEIDYALLLDGLAAEREQGITIDVAWRYFETERRKFIVADTPGHEQYTRNMVTGASRADAAVLLVDARKGLLTQTLRHSYLLRLLGIRNVALAVNKMDLVGVDQSVFDRIAGAYATIAGSLGLTVQAIPLSAATGLNVAKPGGAAPWYSGPTLLQYLEQVPAREEAAEGQPFIMPVQWVSRVGADFRGYAGTIASGSVSLGDALRLFPSRRTASAARIVTMDRDLDRAVAGQSVALTFDREVDCSRGDVLAAPNAPLQIADQFEATLVWMAEQPLLPGRSYRLKLAASTVGAWVTEIKSETNVETLEKLAARTLELNAIGTVNIALDRALPFTSYEESRELGAFILIDRDTEATLGAGLIHHALRRAENVQWQTIDVTREARAAAKNQRPKLLWFTGLSGAGKSTIANLVDRKLHAMGKHSFVLDGDNIRHGLSKNLGFTDADRVENVRRVAEAAKLMTDAGLIVLAALISPFRAEREMVRRIFPPGEFAEIFVDTPLDVAEQRDPKGLYARARSGELTNFTGIDSPYEPPEHPDIRIDTNSMSPEEAATMIINALI